MKREALLLLSLATMHIILSADAAMATPHPAYANFSVPIASYSLNSRDLQFATAAEPKTLSLSVSDYAVYRYAYVSTDGQAWKQVALSGSALGGLWLNGSVTGQLSFTASNFSLSQARLSTGRNFAVVYTCSRTAAGGWDCHSGWQILQFNATIQNSAPILVSGIVSQSGNAYQVAYNGLLPGAVAYTDRTYTFSVVPEAFRGATYIKTPNNDKTLTSQPLVSFSVSKAADVYIAFDDRTSPLPSWLSGWYDTGSSLGIDGLPFEIYAKGFAAGTVSLGPSGDEYASMYSIIVMPNGSCAACATTPSCTDGVRNQGEAGVDCGGPCAACGETGADDLTAAELASVNWMRGPDVTGWAVTSELTGVAFGSGEEICTYHSKAGEWPGYRPYTDFSEPVEANPWIFVNAGGEWYACPYEWYYSGMECRSYQTVSEIASSCDLTGIWNPSAGDEVCFMVTTVARNFVHTAASDVDGKPYAHENQRSNIKCAGWQSETCDGCTACGDGTCNGAETCSTCAGDCGVCPDSDATYAVIGDSMSNEIYGPNYGDWPAYFMAKMGLSEDQLPTYAVSGYNCSEVYDELVYQVEDGATYLFSTCGINDFYGMDNTEWYEAIYNKAKQKGISRIYMTTMPPSNHIINDDVYYCNKMKSENEWLKDFDEQHDDLQVVDLWTMWHDTSGAGTTDCGWQASLQVNADDVHTNAKGAEQWAQKYYELMTGTGEALKVSANGRYLTYQDGTPFFMNGDTAWSMIAEVNRADADYYLQSRAQSGFNAVLVNLIEHKYASSAPANYYGDYPFTGKAFTTPNEAYFAHADYIIQSAQNKGIVVLLGPLYLDTDEGWGNEVMAASESDMLTWGRYVGNRYKDYDNIIWVIGGDIDPSFADTKARKVVEGIRQYSPGALFTAHTTNEKMAVDYWSDTSWLNVNDIYSYDTGVPGVAKTAYIFSPTKPFFMFESVYENEHSSTGVQLRSQAYWTVLSGGFGNVFGNCPMWNFDATTAAQYCGSADWKGLLNTEGTQSMGHFRELFESRSWHLLAPDFSHAVLKSGYGTLGQSNYATAARTSDSATIIIYLPTQRTITVDTTGLSGSSVRSWWYNPRDGTYTDRGTAAKASSQSFTTPTTSGPDWVLVIDDASKGYGPPGEA